ncbi:MAG: cysteine desulfurase [Phycisphaeraceae bacterium]|nr:MAG: cysteine desulfurase [Phycisphaeraceae bacterium]
MSTSAAASSGHARLQSGTGAYDVEAVRRRFPILERRINGHPLVYLDSAATTQKPLDVLDAMDAFHREKNANVHRGVHTLSVEATEVYEAARDKVRRLLGASRPEEIVFLRGVTEAMNLVAQSWGRANVRAGDEILITHMEHHSNIVPWQMLCEQTGATLKVAPVDDRGEVILDAFEKLLNERTKIAAFVHISNALGTVNPVHEMARMSKQVGAIVVIDGAQATPHEKVDVRGIGCDFYAISGHKMYAPTGIGALYGRHELLEAMPPWQGGGDMILSVTFEGTTYNVPPQKFEAGTPNIAGAVALGAAVDFLDGIGLDRIGAHESAVLERMASALREIPGLRLIGEPGRRAGSVSFVVDEVHPHDLGTVVDQEGVAIRTGHHCAQPLMERFGVPATARASIGVYNREADIEALVSAIRKAIEIFS